MLPIPQAKELAELRFSLVTERAKQRREVRTQIEIAFSNLKRVFGLSATLATTLTGLVTRIAAKITGYTYTSTSTVCGDARKARSRSCEHEPRNRQLARVEYQLRAAEESQGLAILAAGDGCVPDLGRAAAVGEECLASYDAGAFGAEEVGL